MLNSSCTTHCWTGMTTIDLNWRTLFWLEKIEIISDYHEAGAQTTQTEVGLSGSGFLRANLLWLGQMLLQTIQKWVREAIWGKGRTWTWLWCHRSSLWGSCGTPQSVPPWNNRLKPHASHQSVPPKEWPQDMPLKESTVLPAGITGDFTDMHRCPLHFTLHIHCTNTSKATQFDFPRKEPVQTATWALDIALWNRIFKLKKIVHRNIKDGKSPWN